MASRRIPIDPKNPGEVMACLGLMELAEFLHGEARAGFFWEGQGLVEFEISTPREADPVEDGLDFLFGAEPVQLAPAEQIEILGLSEDSLTTTETFPGPEANKMTLPVMFRDATTGRELIADHWADESSRNPFKLYAGNRSAMRVYRGMLEGFPNDGQPGARELWAEEREQLLDAPFRKTVPLGGSFNFDPRGAWTAIDVGYSPNDQKHQVTGSPLLETLATIGLSHARPDEFATRRVRYNLWTPTLPSPLARAAFSGPPLFAPTRTFEFALTMSGKNKIVTHAQELP